MTVTDGAPATKAVQLDARGLKCPMPIVKTAQQIKTIASGDAARGPGHRSRSGRRLCGVEPQHRQRVVSSTVADGVYRFVLRRK